MGFFNLMPGRRRRLHRMEHLLSYQAANLQCIGTRERQEDSFAFVNALDVTEIRRKGLLAVVADGMGGMSDGKQVSEACVSSILSEFQNMDRDGNLAAQFKESVMKTNENLYKRFCGKGGTTLVAALIYQENLFWISIGDSYLYLKRGKGLYRLNRDQNYRSKLYLEAIRSGTLNTAKADSDPDGPRLSEFLGSESIEEVDQNFRAFRLIDGDTILLCSDGVGGVLKESEILECLSTVSTRDMCAKLDSKIKTLNRLNQDNYTALVIRCAY